MPSSPNSSKDRRGISFTKTILEQRFGKNTARAVSTGTSRLPYAFDSAIGFWGGHHSSGEVPGEKPPGVILHLEVTPNGPVVTFPRDPKSGNELPNAHTIGYINTGNCRFFLAPLFVAIKDDQSGFQFPDDWEWVLVITFSHFVPNVGGSAKSLTEFSPVQRTVYLNNERRDLCYVGLGTCGSPANTIDVGNTTVTYSDATAAIATFLDIDSGPHGDTDNTPDPED